MSFKKDKLNGCHCESVEMIISLVKSTNTLNSFLKINVLKRKKC